MACRTILQSSRGRQYLAHKTLLTRKGDYARNTLCGHHIGVLQKYLGKSARLNTGRAKMLADPDAEYASRGASGKFLRAFLFERSGSSCQNCAVPLDFFAPPKTWQIDHIIPMMRGGQTKLANLQVLCAVCHDEKSVGEKSEAGRNRHSATKVNRWLTHHQKDILIDRLRARLAALGAPID
jgi:5-methylcytosine-specific restriction endonuclease McrA